MSAIHSRSGRISRRAGLFSAAKRRLIRFSLKRRRTREVRRTEKRLNAFIAEEAPAGEIPQLCWLRDRLQIYLDHWLGFAKLADIPFHAGLDNQAFWMFLAATNIMDARLQTSDAIAGEIPEWEDLKTSIERICVSLDREDLALVEGSFGSFAAAISRKLE